ncbi:hypothetical protein PsorP6_017638 [Peronosclerospora sorghi]|uniref:Uncharacterized protein n=1 Tax=Peronosclerospora sorghi TaxID=230839 RepID=A0ACC0WNN9_9STRA|nr:hypothetical protein PsorP6_017638 [Peronosclerospora sorghi]
MSKANLGALALPRLDLSSLDIQEILELSVSLLNANLRQHDELPRMKDGLPDPTVWREVRRKEGIRVFKEVQPPRSRPTAPRMRSSVDHADESKMPSLLLLGSMAGHLKDVIYAAMATTTNSMRSLSAFVQDGVVDSKVISRIEAPSLKDPFHSLHVTWRYYTQSKPRDYTCIEATGLIPTDRGELVGFHLIHSLEFKELPNFRNYGVERANMSTCTFFRQKSPTFVDCYTRGYFDFHSMSEKLNNVSVDSISSQWLSMARYVEYAQMKKLLWWMRTQMGRDPFSSIKQCAKSGAADGSRRMVRTSDQAEGRCRVCTRISSGFLRSKPYVCVCCGESVCKPCRVKKRLCIVISSGYTTEVYDEKVDFCAHCIAEASHHDVSLICRDELVGYSSSCSSTPTSTNN